MKSIVFIGMITLDFLHTLHSYPEENTENQVFESGVSIGGPIGRASVTCARLGIPTTAIGMIGKGIYADILRNEIAKEQLDINFVEDPLFNSSQHSFVLLSGNGQSRTTFWTPQPRANDELLSSIRDKIINASCVLLDCTDEKLSLAVAKTASSLGIVTVIDTGSYKPFVESILPYVNHIVSPEKFFQKRATVMGEKYEAQMDMILKKYNAKSIVMTRGEKGGCYQTPEMSTSTPYLPYEVTAIDTCGAGDTFHGAFVYALTQGWTINKVVQFSSWVAAQKCRVLGNGSLPSKNDIQFWLSKN